MNFRLLIALLVWIPCYSMASDKAYELPADVATFVERRDLCDHFRGEEPYDEQRRKFLNKNIIEIIQLLWVVSLFMKKTLSQITESGDTKP